MNSTKLTIRELDIIFMSYGEPNAEMNWADLLKKAPWAKRVKDVKGFDAVHRKAAELCDTEWFVTVDADTVMDESFLDLTLNIVPSKPKNFCWSSRNVVNGLCYGNGGLKVWHKPFAASMAFHELGNHTADFCWDPDYRSYSEVYSDVIINSSPLQAFRAGFREGIKLTMSNGRLLPPTHWIRIRPTTLRYLKIWTSLGLHIDNGQWAICGARQGLLLAAQKQVDQTRIGDFEYIDSIYSEIDDPMLSITQSGQEIQKLAPITLELFTKTQSSLIREVYDRSQNQRTIA